MQIGKKKNHREEIVSKQPVRETYVLSEENVEVQEADKSKKCKQSHRRLIAEAEEPNKRVSEKFNEGCAGSIKAEPCVAAEVLLNLSIVTPGV